MATIRVTQKYHDGYVNTWVIRDLAEDENNRKTRLRNAGVKFRHGKGWFETESTSSTLGGYIERVEWLDKCDACGEWVDEISPYGQYGDICKFCFKRLYQLDKAEANQ